MADNRPVLVIVAGPNGSGKTTLTSEVLDHRWLDGCVYINADNIAQQEFGNWNSAEAVLNAARRADEMRGECLRAHSSMAFETVFSTPGRLEFLEKAAQAGYFIRLFFVGTEDPTINIRRVAQRVREGGHDVPIDKIIACILERSEILLQPSDWWIAPISTTIPSTTGRCASCFAPGTAF